MRLFLLLTIIVQLAGVPDSFGQDVSGFFLDPGKAITQYQLNTWTSEDGLPQNSITAITQTRDGYLWLGTQEGLVRFDGLTFKVFDKGNTPFTHNTISALFQDKNNNLWIGTRDGGLVRYQDGQFEHYSEADGLTSGDISSVIEDGDGILWVGTYDAGVNRLTKGRFEPYIEINQRAGDNINVLYAASNGSLLIGTRDAGLFRMQGDDITSYTIDDGLPNNDITALYETADTLWIGTRDAGLVQIVDDVITTYTTADGLPSDNIEILFEDRHNTFWIGTRREGLCRLRDGVFEIFGQDEGLTASSIRALYEDFEGNLWIGTGGGLNQLWNGKFDTYTTKEGLGSDVVYAVYEDTQGRIWAGTGGGGISRYEDGTVTTYTTADGLADDYVLAIAETVEGSLWFGTYGGGLSRFKDGHFTSFNQASGIPSNNIFALYTDAGGDLWIGTDRGLGRYRDGVFSTFTTEDGLSSNQITALLRDRADNLWVGTYDGGLNLMREGQVVTSYGSENGLDGNFVLSLYEDDEGTLWMGMRDVGLYQFKKGRFFAFSTKNGLFNDNVYQILEDENERLWMSCNKGLFYVDKKELALFAEGKREGITSIVFDKTDGLKDSEFNGGFQPAGWKSRTGDLWFPSNLGLAVVQPESIPKNLVPPSVVIEGVTADDKLVSVQQETTIAPGHRKFSFQYVGLSYIAPKEIKYQYMLEGIDQEWVEAGSRREAFYTNISPGLYRFRVRAFNADGVMSSREASVSFYLEPFFYQTSWFLVLSCLALLTFIFVLHRWRIGHLEARKRELERVVDERTRDLRTAKDEIEVQAKKLKELDRLKTRFFNNISHEFRTPLTLNIGPLENALTGIYGSVNNTLREQLEIMLRNSRRLLRLINQLLDLAKLESGRMGLKMQHSDLVPLLEGVVYSFTSFAEKKRLNLSFETDQADQSFFFDPENLEKVVFNLLSNAVKFTPEGGAISITLRKSSLVLKGASLEAAEIRVKDTGAGIPEANLNSIFDRFQQVDGQVSQVQAGTGIGLALVKELVELHNGTVHVNSTPGEGTEFIILIPKEVIHAPESAPSELPAQPWKVSSDALIEMAIMDRECLSGDGAQDVEATCSVNIDRPTLLIVDDNPDIRHYVKSCLGNGYHIIMARDGQEGIETARKDQPALIVSDVMMPRVTGYELCRTIKEDPDLKYIPIILLTSKASTEDKIEGLEAGADDYLCKPFSAKELLVRVQNLLILREHQKELAKLNEELTRSNTALHEANELKSQFVRIAAHDLKNPLNNIREFSKIVKEGIGEENGDVELLDLIIGSSNQMFDLISNILESEALESGNLNLELRPLDLSALAETVVSEHQKQAEQKDQQLLFDGNPEAECSIEGCQDWLREAVANLISNAIKYSPYGKPIRVGVKTIDGFVHYSVSDEGPGIPEEDRDKLFKKFQRLSAVPTGNESSTGLGLSIAKQITEMHNGFVEIESEPGQGSTFTLSFPALATEQIKNEPIVGELPA